MEYRRGGYCGMSCGAWKGIFMNSQFRKPPDNKCADQMNDRAKTAFILGISSLFLFSPLAMSLFWRPIPLFQNLGFERQAFAPPLAWILATLTTIVYVLFTMKAIPLVLAKQKEISLFKLLGILAALVGGIVEEVFFRRWLMDMLMSRGVDTIIYLVGGRNLGPCIFAHVLINIIIEPWLMLSSVSGKRSVELILPVIEI